jgi:hypothetical protein
LELREFQFMPSKQATSDENYSEAESEQRREAILKRMLATPHTPQKKQAPKAKTRKSTRKPKS